MFYKEPKKDTPKENFNDFKPGDILQGAKIKSIFSASKNYIVYNIKSSPNSISFTYNKTDEISSVLSSITPKIVEVEGILRRLYSQKKYISLKARAIVEGCNGNQETALSVLERVKELAQKDYQHQIKISYLFWTLLLIIINSIISLLMFYTKDILNYGIVYNYFLIATFGSFGGFLSTIYKINRLDFAEEDSKILLFFLSVSRVFLSMLSSIVIYVLIKSNILLGVFNNVENDYVFYIFSIAAGFSETFIPDILKKIQNTSQE